MKIGSTGLDLELTLRFHQDGALSGLHSIATSGGIELPPKLAKELYDCLSNMRRWEVLVDECAANSEPEVDECDDVAGAAE